MIPGPFEYHAPTSLDEALALLTEHGEDAKVLAGGQSLIPLMRFRLAQPARLVDLRRVPGLSYIEQDNGWLRIGAMTREAALDRSPVIAERYPLLAETAAMIADPLVRNLATLGGNLAHADPANDHPAAMLAFHAELIMCGPQGERTVTIDDFFAGPFTTVLEPDELLTEIRIPTPPGRSGGAYEKLERKVGDYAIAAAAAQLTLAEDGTVVRVGIATTNVSYELQRCSEAEAALVGRIPEDEAIREAAYLAAQAAEPSSDLRGPADYKRAVTRTVTRRALIRAAERARGAA